MSKKHSGAWTALWIVLALLLLVGAVIGAAALGPGTHAVATWWRYITRDLRGDARTTYDDAADTAYSATGG